MIVISRANYSHPRHSSASRATYQRPALNRLPLHMYINHSFFKIYSLDLVDSLEISSLKPPFLLLIVYNDNALYNTKAIRQHTAPTAVSWYSILTGFRGGYILGLVFRIRIRVRVRIRVIFFSGPIHCKHLSFIESTTASVTLRTCQSHCL